MALPSAAVLGALTWVGWRLAVGTDPTLAELYARIEGVTPETAAQIMSAASASVTRIRVAAKAMGGCSQGKALSRIAEMFDGIIGQLRSTPAKLPKARRFLSVYLDGVADAGERFSQLRKQEHKPGLDDSFDAFLAAAKDTAEKQRQALIADDEFNLDVDLEVLRKRMTLEGV